jgi:hypothetical protein
MRSTAGNTPGPATARPSPQQVRRLRRAGIAALALLLIQAGIGIGVNLAVTIPAADHGHGLGTAISNGPAALSVHVVTGLLLILAAIGLLAQAIVARHRPMIIASVLALLAITGAAFAGSGFVSSGREAASAAMAIFGGVALACYAAGLFLLRPPRNGVASS